MVALAAEEITNQLLESCAELAKGHVVEERGVALGQKRGCGIFNGARAILTCEEKDYF